MSKPKIVQFVWDDSGLAVLFDDGRMASKGYEDIWVRVDTDAAAACLDKPTAPSSDDAAAACLAPAPKEDPPK